MCTLNIELICDLGSLDGFGILEISLTSMCDTLTNCCSEITGNYLWTLEQLTPKVQITLRAIRILPLSPLLFIFGVKSLFLNSFFKSIDDICHYISKCETRQPAYKSQRVSWPSAFQMSCPKVPRSYSSKDHWRDWEHRVVIKLGHLHSGHASPAHTGLCVC